MNRQEIFRLERSGVAQVVLEKDREQLTAGSAFLVAGGLVTNSHVLRDVDFDVAFFRFEGMPAGSGIRLAREACLDNAVLAYESPRDEHDVAYLYLSEPEFHGRHVFDFGDSSNLHVGDKIAFLGFPFQMPQLTCHVGYVSSLNQRGSVDLIQIDGSVNGGNSGGPLVDLANGRVVGVVTRAEIGFVADQFDDLMRTLQANVELLQRNPGGLMIQGIDPVRGLLSSQAAMLQIAENLRRSANVGIGYAFSANHIRDRIAEHSTRTRGDA